MVVKVHRMKFIPLATSIDRYLHRFFLEKLLIHAKKKSKLQCAFVNKLIFDSLGPRFQDSIQTLCYSLF